ncbi:MAG: LEA type 2 family protein [Oceanospirillaceae bacterium]|nr:LEA type 2 family protein [Oceanospirillaceae bacterium]
MISRLIGMALILWLSGCSALQETMDVEKPTVTVEGVSLKSVSTDSMTLLLEVKLDNPNTFELKTVGVDLDLSINKNTVAKISKSDISVTIPAKDSNSIRLPVTLMFDQILKSVEGLPDKNGLDYVVKGDVTINVAVLGDWAVSVDYSGALSVPKPLEMFF